MVPIKNPVERRRNFLTTVRHMVSLVTISLLLGTCVKVGNAELLDSPAVRWTFQLEGSRTLGQGNKVQVWNDYVFVAAQDASLHILDSVLGTTKGIFEGPSIPATCESSVAIVQVTDEDSEASRIEPYLVYAVNLQPDNEDTTTVTQSRVIAVNIEDASVRWSVDISGRIVGTPAVGRSGRFLYVSHRNVTNTTTTTTTEDGNNNANNENGGEGSGGEMGYLSVIAIDEMHTKAIVTATLPPPDNRMAILGPPALQQISFVSETTSTTEDFIAIAEQPVDGTTTTNNGGRLYILVPSADWTSFQGLGDASYEWRIFTEGAWRFPTVAKPTFVDNWLFIGGVESIFAGWTSQSDISTVLSGENVDVDPAWILQLRRNNNADERKSVLVQLEEEEEEEDSSTYFFGDFFALLSWACKEFSPIPPSFHSSLFWSPYHKNRNQTPPPMYSTAFVTSPLVSLDGSQVYIVSAESILYNIRADTGRVPWITNLDAPVISQPILFEGQDSTRAALYIMESSTGRIRQYLVNAQVNDAQEEDNDGQETWSFDCEDLSGIARCTDAVEADFSLTDSGNTLVYGDTFGRITALQVATFSTSAPTVAPIFISSATPTLSEKTTAPISTPSSSSFDTEAPTSSPTIIPIKIVIPGFGSEDSSALSDKDDKDDDDDDDEVANIGLMLGIMAASSIIIFAVVLFLARNLLRKPRQRKRVTHKLVVADDENVEVDLEDVPNDEGNNYRGGDREEDSVGDDDDDDNGTVISVSSGEVELERIAAVGGGGALTKAGGAGAGFRTPKKKRKMKKPPTPPTTSTLESIQEAPDDEEPAEWNQTNLETRFRSVSDDGESVDDDTVASIPPPPPPPVHPEHDGSNDGYQEEKKETDFITLSPKPSYDRMDHPPLLGEAPTSPSSTASSDGASSSFTASVNRALDYVTATSTSTKEKQPAAATTKNYEIPSLLTSPSMFSTDSSIYTSNDNDGDENHNRSAGSTRSVSPLSAMFGDKPDDGSIPGDEKRNSLSDTGGLYDYRATPAVPGAHYLTKGGTRPRFTPSGQETAPQIKSARTSRNFSGFSGSYLNNNENASTSSDESQKDTKAPPSFKRRNKQEKNQQQQEPPTSFADTISDSWNSFLEDLAAAEEQFFSPTAAQKSVVLRYTKDEDSLVSEKRHGTVDNEDDGTVQTDDRTVKTGAIV